MGIAGPLALELYKSVLENIGEDGPKEAEFKKVVKDALKLKEKGESVIVTP